MRQLGPAGRVPRARGTARRFRRTFRVTCVRTSSRANRPNLHAPIRTHCPARPRLRARAKLRQLLLPPPPPRRWLLQQQLRVVMKLRLLRLRRRHRRQQQYCQFWSSHILQRNAGRSAVRSLLIRGFILCSGWSRCVVFTQRIAMWLSCLLRCCIRVCICSRILPWNV